MLTFTFDNGSPAPAQATFSYDAAKPLNSRFSNFVISWSGQSYDFTSAANSPMFQGDLLPNLSASCIPTPDSAGVFYALTYPGGCPGLITSGGGYFWQTNATTSTGSSEFRLLLLDVPLHGWIPKVEGVGAGGAPTSTVEGLFVVRAIGQPPTPTPLPNSIIFALTGIGLVSLWLLQRRMKMRSAV